MFKCFILIIKVKFKTSKDKLQLYHSKMIISNRIKNYNGSSIISKYNFCTKSTKYNLRYEKFLNE